MTALIPRIDEQFGKFVMCAVDLLVMNTFLPPDPKQHERNDKKIYHQTSGAAAGADLDATVQDGLDLTELADVLIEAGAVNAINLVGGGPSAMTRNHSAIVDPTGACSDPLSFGGDGENGGGGGGDDEDGSAAIVAVPQCDVPVSSIVCVHADPPPFVPQASGGDGETDGVLSPSSSAGNGEGTKECACVCFAP